MTLKRKIEILASITTRDEAGRHFTGCYESEELDALEAEGLININRPVHAATGIPYSTEYCSVVVTEEGYALLEQQS